MSKTVLVVEDDNLARKSLAAELEEKGLEVKQAANGKLGLEIALDIKPDLIVSDVRMPEMDGLAMVEELRKDSWGKDVPVIMLTTDEAADSVNEAMRAGVTVYLPKTTMNPQIITEQVLIGLG